MNEADPGIGIPVDDQIAGHGLLAFFEFFVEILLALPHDRPEPDEVASCEPFLIRQLGLIGPEVIVALGKFAVQSLLRTKSPITQLRGRWYDYHGIRLMPTFHPAYLLRNPADKRLVWEDIQKVMKALGIGVAGK